MHYGVTMNIILNTQYQKTCQIINLGKHCGH